MTHYKAILATSIVISLTITVAQASLTAETSGGQSVVYDDVTNITWTGDANLLGTLENSLGYDTVVNAIIAASPVIDDTPNAYDTPVGSYSGHHSVSVADFFAGGKVSWFGALAFANYLNSTHYAGSSQWALPSPGVNPGEGYNKTSSQFGELFYNELGGTAGNSMPNTSYFTNEQVYQYWLSTDYASFPDDAWSFETDNGSQEGVFSFKPYYYYAWAISPGNIATVPVPSTVWLFGSGLIGLAGLKRRGNMG